MFEIDERCMVFSWIDIFWITGRRVPNDDATVHVLPSQENVYLSLIFGMRQRLEPICGTRVYLSCCVYPSTHPPEDRPSRIVIARHVSVMVLGILSTVLSRPLAPIPTGFLYCIFKPPVSPRAYDPPASPETAYAPQTQRSRHSGRSRNSSPRPRSGSCRSASRRCSTH